MPFERKVEIILGRKNCTRCKRWLHLHEFHVRVRHPDGSAKSYQTACKACQRTISRVQKGIRARGIPYEARKDITRKEKLANRRARYSVLMQDPQRVADRREYNRIYAEAKRREAGITRRNFKNKTLPGFGELLPIEPLAHWFEKKLSNGYKGEPGRLALRCGINERALSRILNGEQDQVTEDFVDKVLMAEGSTHLWEVYPHLYTA